jgi:hypothetical protein
MRTAQYLRAQAEFCLQAARRISDPKTVENLKVDAARYYAEATEVETTRPTGSKSNVFSLEGDHPRSRLLRDLRDGLQALYNKDQTESLPPRMVDLLKVLENRKLPETH